MNDPTHAERMMLVADRFAGWPLIEIYGVGPDGTCQCPRARNCKSPGKHPRGEDWQTPGKPLVLEEVFAAHPRANLGTLTGKPAGFWVLDIDQPGLGAMQELVRQNGELPQTRVHLTGGGTYHYFFAMPEFDVTNRRGRLPVGVDARGTGGQVVLPASRSSKGHYDIVRDADIVPAPDWLLDLIRPEVVETRDELPSNVRHAGGYERAIIDGEVGRLKAMAAAATDDTDAYRGEPWDDTTYRVACQLFELANADWSALTPDEAEALVLEHAPRDSGFDDHRVREKITSARGKVGDKAREPQAKESNTAWFDDMASDGPTSSEPAAPEYPARGFNDAGNADRLVDRHGGEIRWAVDAETWLAYDGRRWNDGGSATIIKGLARRTIEEAKDGEAALYSDTPDEFTAKGDPKSSPRQRFYEWIGKSLFETRLKAMVNVAQPDRRVAAMMGEFDTNPALLNVANGVVDLRTGRRIDHDPTLMLKSIADVEYDELAQCPLFDAFLERVQPDVGMRAYLQTVAGYSITGETREQALFLHNGHGANGKSVFLEIIREILGDMGQKMARDTIMSKNGQASGIPDDVASMLGGRFLIGSETAAGKKLDDERIKELVGGEAQRARHLYGKWFDFHPTGKIHIATNHLPMMESGGHGMGRRLRVVPWEVTIPEAEQDKMLKEKIIATEAPGVLAWLVRGAVQWYAQGLRTPEVVSDRTSEHIEDADPIMPFIREKLVVEEGAETRFTDLFHHYEQWCRDNGVRAMSGKALSQGLVERLGHGARFLNQPKRQSCFRVRVVLEAVPDYHAEFFASAR